MNELFDGEECGTLAGDADPGDVDLMAEHALPHIGLAALTGGINARAGQIVAPDPDLFSMGPGHASQQDEDRESDTE